MVLLLIDVATHGHSRTCGRKILRPVGPIAARSCGARVPRQRNARPVPAVGVRAASAARGVIARDVERRASSPSRSRRSVISVRRRSSGCSREPGGSVAVARTKTAVQRGAAPLKDLLNRLLRPDHVADGMRPRCSRRARGEARRHRHSRRHGVSWGDGEQTHTTIGTVGITEGRWAAPPPYSCF
jgi:hypothetical protein